LNLVFLLYPLLGHVARLGLEASWARSLSAGCSCGSHQEPRFGCFCLFAQLLHATIWLAYKGTIEFFRSFPDIPNFGEFAMQEVVDKVMQTYGMMKTMSGEELEEAREVLLDFLSKRPGTDEHTATVESLTFLRNLKT
jgi:hypothetical protein